MVGDPVVCRSRSRYRHRIAEMTESKGAHFLDYDCDKGLWQFCTFDAGTGRPQVPAVLAEVRWHTWCPLRLVVYTGMGQKTWSFNPWARLTWLVGQPVGLLVLVHSHINPHLSKTSWGACVIYSESTVDSM